MNSIFRSFSLMIVAPNCALITPLTVRQLLIDDALLDGDSVLSGFQISINEIFPVREPG